MGETYKNKLTSCFDDILKISSEMMMQQQLKNVQLDPYMVNGFSAQHQGALKEKIHLFHGMLDDLENALSKSNYYVESVASMGKENKRAEMERLKKLEEEKKRLREEEEARKKEEEEARRKEEEEAKAAAAAKAEAEARAAKAAADEEEKRKRQEEEEKQKQQQQQQASASASMFDGLDFTTDLSSNNNNTTIKSPMGMAQASMGDDGEKKDSSRGFGGDTQKGLYGDLNTMDLSMFSDLDAGSFDTAGFDNNTGNNNNNNNNNNTSASNDLSNNNKSNNNDNNNTTNNSNSNNGGSNNNDNSNSAFNIPGNNDSGLGQEQLDFDQSNPSAMLGNDINMGDNGEDYLTLNDFNDLNIDWSTTGEGGDLDLNGFNI
ncbi:Mediator of RNA polymerase II transcription subunit 2 [Nakaseomyces bracarensis]|uniref:Mediator of RNA polymerase II transcription subunit 2 n=1 Tax=Nakaseomyces bracarensis TaxID=273131 RepID=A0ABR4NQW5_9SACH